jgi:hypothetical protein
MGTIGSFRFRSRIGFNLTLSCSALGHPSR